MKHYLPLLLTALMALSSCATSSEKPLNGTPTGEIKYLSAYAERTFNGKNGGDIVFHYDKNGNEIKREILNPDKSLNWKMTSAYDADGKLVEEVLYLKFKSGKRTIHLVYEYENGRMVRRLSTSEGEKKPPWITNYEYDASGNIVKEVTAYEGMDPGEDESAGTTIKEYYEGTDLVKKRTDYDYKMKLKNYYIFGYENGLRTKETYYDADGKIIESSTISYGPHGEKLLVKGYDADGRLKSEVKHHIMEFMVLE